ncbi:MAG: hypothetical protein O2973_03260 [Gemmatimonadetes bacterium]|nr:hypothetical protein [Gemmatimonadota bacterium]
MVAIQGAPGSFSEGAARQLVGADADLLSCESFDELFASVASGRAERGVVPVHNTIAGPVYDNSERALSEPFTILGQLMYPVEQCLIARPGTPTATLRRVASHPVALRQCTRFFEAHPECVAVEVSDTGGAVRDLMLGHLAADAVIASAAAAHIYRAAVLTKGIEDRADNFTEFLLIACRGIPTATRLHI